MPIATSVSKNRDPLVATSVNMLHVASQWPGRVVQVIKPEISRSWRVVRGPNTVSKVYQLSKDAVYTYSPQQGGTDQNARDALDGLDIKWLESADFAEGWRHAIDELDEYTYFEAGWRGEGSMPVQPKTAEQALVVLKQMASALPNGHFPLVGADDDGCLVLTWHYGGLAGNMSFSGNGKYAYYIERRGAGAHRGVARVFEPVSDDLLSVLRA